MISFFKNEIMTFPPSLKKLSPGQEFCISGLA